jgi:drug/metabolite transporter (DMT)-like permease
MSAEHIHISAASSQSSSPDASYGQTKEEGILKTRYLGVPGSQQRRSSLESSFSDLSELSFLSDEIRNTQPFASGHAGNVSSSPTGGFKGYMRSFWTRNKGLVLVLAAMFFGSGMNVGTRLLETPGPHGAPMHPYQILFVRQSITALCCTAFGIWSKKIPDFPFGPRKIRWLLVSRGLFGFFGVFGFYFSLIYLPLAEATVLTFLGPIITCYVYSLTIPGETFTRQQQMAGFVSLGGVIFIALSATVSSSSIPSTPDAQGHAVPSNSTSTPSDIPASSGVSPQQHLAAVGISMIGVMGAVGAMTSIRAIGTQVHPFLSINYFSVWCSIVSLICLVIFPSVSFRLPGNLLEWLLFAMLGSCGFIMQFLLTAGLAYGGPNGEPKHSDVETSAESSASGRRASKDVKASGTRATSMLYTQMLFSLIGDKLVFGVTPTILSWIGSGLILGGAMWVAAANETDKPKEPSKKEWAKEDLAFGAGDGAEVLLQDESSKPDQTDMPGPATQVNDHAIELENMGRNDHESKNVLL